MRKDLEKLIGKEDKIISRRELLALGATIILFGSSGCGSGGSSSSGGFIPTPSSSAQTPNLPPGVQPQSNYHNYSGSVKDTNGNPLYARVSLTQLVQSVSPIIFSDDTDGNGNYFIGSVPNSDFRESASVIATPGDFFPYGRDVQVISGQGDIGKDFVLIKREPIVSTVYRTNNQPDLLQMIKDISGNLSTDPIQKVRRFDVSNGKITVYLDRNNASLGYISAIEDALTGWENAFGSGLFEETNLSGSAHIKFAYVSSAQIGTTSIIEERVVNGTSIPRRVQISLKNNLGPSDLKAVSLRELGYVLFGARRYSKDRLHVIFKDSSLPNNLITRDVTLDEELALRSCYGLQIGEDLRPYTSN